MLSGMTFLTGVGMVIAGKSIEAANRRRYEEERLAEKARRESYNFCPDHILDALCNHMRSMNGYGIDLLNMSSTVDWSAVSLPERAEQCLVAEFFIELLTDYELDWKRQQFVPRWLSSWKREHNMMDYLAKDYFMAINTPFVFNPKGYRSMFEQWLDYKEKLQNYLTPYYLLGVEPPIDIYKMIKENRFFKIENEYGCHGENLPPEVKEKCREEYVALEYKWW